MISVYPICLAYGWLSVPKVGGMGYSLPGVLTSFFESLQAFTLAHCAEVAAQAEQWFWKVS